MVIETRRKRTRGPRVLAASSSGTFINIGAPDSDEFTKSIFDNDLGSATPKLKITSQSMDNLRREVMGFVNTKVNGNSNSLDIIAHAPGGFQAIFQSPLFKIVNDPDSSVTLDDDLVKSIKERFRQVRLLGCVTAVDAQVWAHALRIANLFQMRVVGTLRAISLEDFDDKSFKDTQTNGQKIVTEIDPQATDSHERSAKRIALAGRIQQAWLASFRQVTIERNDIFGVPSSHSWIWNIPNEVVGSTVAATDVIHTFVDAIVTLQTPSGVRVHAEALARGTLLRLQSRRYGPVYMNVPPDSTQRENWLLHGPKLWPAI